MKYMDILTIAGMMPALSLTANAQRPKDKLPLLPWRDAPERPDPEGILVSPNRKYGTEKYCKIWGSIGEIHKIFGNRFEGRSKPFKSEEDCIKQHEPNPALKQEEEKKKLPWLEPHHGDDSGKPSTEGTYGTERFCKIWDDDKEIEIQYGNLSYREYTSEVDCIKKHEPNPALKQGEGDSPPAKDDNNKLAPASKK
jgi:hypothetical protein